MGKVAGRRDEEKRTMASERDGFRVASKMSKWRDTMEYKNRVKRALNIVFETASTQRETQYKNKNSVNIYIYIYKIIIISLTPRQKHVTH